MNAPFVSTADGAATGVGRPEHAHEPADAVHPKIDTCLSGHAAGRCLRPLLDELGWRGEERHLLEALPHLEQVEDVEALRAVLTRLNYETHGQKVTLSALGDEALPCLFETADGRVSVIRARVAGLFEAIDGETGGERHIPPDDVPGTAYLVREVDTNADRLEMSRMGWMFGIVSRFRFLIWQLLGITFVTNVFALAIPLYTMNVYDKVIGTKSQHSLAYFLAGVLVVVLADVALRSIRARATAYLGARCETIVGSAAFQQLLCMPVSMTERAPIGSQITRLKQFEGIRDIFTGTIAGTALDMPFLVVFLGAIIIIGGQIAWVPVALIAAYAIMAAITIPLTKYHVGVTGEARSKLQSFLIEAISQHRTIRSYGAESVWSERFNRLSGESVLRHFRSQQLNFVVQTLSQNMVTLAGVATLWIGTLMVMAGDLSLGALIAVMALVWRVLAPINSAFLSLNRLSQVVQTFKQINMLMRLKLERIPGQVPSSYREFEGMIQMSRVGFRYTPRSEPALVGTTVEIPSGQFVLVAGHSGAGKSTLLKLIAGLYAPQAGAVHIDGLDVRQLDPGELRHAIAYVPQQAKLFHGTLDQNILLAHPTASDADIERACREARIDDASELLPHGRDTRLDAELQHRMPSAVKQRIALARAFVKDARIVLLDEPASGLDQSGEEGLLEKVESLRGKATVIMVSHRPSHMRAADRIVFMECGQIVHDGKPEQVLPLILGE